MKGFQGADILLDDQHSWLIQIVDLPPALVGGLLAEVIIDVCERGRMRVAAGQANANPFTIFRIAGTSNKTFVNAFLGLLPQVVVSCSPTLGQLSG